MREVNDNPVDPLGTLGQAIRPTKPAQPDPIREFELVGDHNRALESIAETLRKKAAPVPVISDGQESDWEGLCIEHWEHVWFGVCVSVQGNAR